MASGLNYGVQSFEGLKAFRGPDGRVTIFRPDQNAKRMHLSAGAVCIPPVPEELFVDAVNKAVAVNAEFVPPHETGAAMYVRPLLFGSSPQIGLHAPEEFTFVVFVMPTGQAAYAAGYGITLHLDSATRTEIDEFSTSAFLGVKTSEDGKVTIIVPQSKNVLKSVTSDSTCDVASKVLGYTVERRPLKYEELGSLSEVIAAGTAASLVPIKSITLKSKSDKFEFTVGKDNGPGPVTEKLLTTLKGIQLGNLPDKFGWNHIVTPAPQGFVPDAKAEAA
ncbi:hypothetical protein DV735_g792, partial [Chaetothyriales sp. CBS 134920]